MNRLLRTLVLAIATLVTSLASAQRLPDETIDSIDAKVLNAASITVATVKEFSEEKGTGTHQVTLAVRETLRGEAKPEIRGKITVPPARLEVWRQRAVPLLIFNDRRTGWLDPIDLPTASSNNVFATARYSGDRVPVSTEDFAILPDAEAILRYVREVIGQHPDVTRIDTVAIEPPKNEAGERWKRRVGRHGDGGLVVPADDALERRAFEYLRTVNRMSLYRVGQMIRPFKSARNIERLKAMLHDPEYEVTIPAERFRGVELRDYSRRQLAAQILQDWGVSFPEPVTRERVSKAATITTLTMTMDPDLPDIGFLRDAKRLKSLTVEYGATSDEQLRIIGGLTGLTRLTINRARLSDGSLDLLANLKNLHTLNLNDNPITDAGLKLVDRLPHLKEISLAGTQTTEAGIAALRRAHPRLRVVTWPPST